MSSAFEGLPKTPNLKLNKPGYDNVADIEALNENADILDAEIQGIKNTFVKSVNGINAGDGGNVDLGIMPISQGGTGATTAENARANLGAYSNSGGLMRGSIKFTNDSELRVAGGEGTTAIYLLGTKDNYNSNFLCLADKNHDTPKFELGAGNGTTSKRLVGKPDGTLTWDGNEIYHAGKTVPIANGGTGANNASQACANIGALPTAGGTMTGAIKWNDVELVANNSNLTWNGKDILRCEELVKNASAYGSNSITLSNGLIIQFFKVSLSSGGAFVNYPKAFSNTCCEVFCQHLNLGSEKSPTALEITYVSDTNFYIKCYFSNTGAMYNVQIDFMVLAIGY